jgi:hypothetical protein
MRQSDAVDGAAAEIAEDGPPVKAQSVEPDQRRRELGGAEIVQSLEHDLR